MLAILSNPEVVAADQDPLGAQGFRVARTGSTEVWKKPLADGSCAVALRNRGERAETIAARWADLGIAAGEARQAHDLWARDVLGESDVEVSLPVAPHETRFLRLFAAGQ